MYYTRRPPLTIFGSLLKAFLQVFCSFRSLGRDMLSILKLGVSQNRTHLRTIFTYRLKACKTGKTNKQIRHAALMTALLEGTHQRVSPHLRKHVRAFFMHAIR